MISVPLKLTAFRLETEIMAALAAIRERDGIPVTEQVRRALKLWIAQKGGTIKSDRVQGGKRRRR